MAYEELKQRQSVMWGNGPYQRITETLDDIHERVIERLGPRAGRPMARPGPAVRAPSRNTRANGRAKVTGLDLSPVLVETAKERAAERGLDID